MNILNEVTMYGDLPFPEPIEAIKFQLELVKNGVKPCVLMPHYSSQISGNAFDGFRRYEHPRGIIVVNDCFKGIDSLLDEMTMAPGFALGYGVADKPSPTKTNAAILLENKEGIELLAIAYEFNDFPNVRSSMNLYATSLKSGPGLDYIRITTCEEVVANRIRYWAKQYGVKTD